MTETNPAQRPDPRRVIQIAEVIPHVYAAPDVRVIQELVVEALQTTPPAEGRDLVTHLAQHFLHVFPLVMADPRAVGPLERMLRAYDEHRPAFESEEAYAAFAGITAQDGHGHRHEHGDEHDQAGPSEGEGEVVTYAWGGAIALGAGAAAIAGYYALEALAAYCGDVHPAKGESAPVHC